MTITERIYAADYAEGVPEVIVGYCLFTLVESANSFEGNSYKGFGTSTAVIGSFDPALALNRSIGTTVDIKHGFNAYKLDPSFIINPPSLEPASYTSETDRTLPDCPGGPPEITIPGRTVTTRFTIECDSETIVLKPPKFSDTDTLDYKRVNSQTIGGKLIIYRDPNWTAIERFNVQWDNLEKEHYRNLLDFLLRHAGKTLTLTDHHGFNWTVKQSNVGAEGSEGVNDRYTYQLEVETVDA